MRRLVTGKSVLFVICGLLVVGGSAGCQVARKSFQMDSDSRVPIFGLQFVPKKNKPDVTSIGHDSAKQAEATVLNLDQTDQPRSRARWPQWLSRLGKPKRIPLPITPTPPASNIELAEDIRLEQDGLHAF